MIVLKELEQLRLDILNDKMSDSSTVLNELVKRGLFPEPESSVDKKKLEEQIGLLLNLKRKENTELDTARLYRKMMKDK